MGTRRNGARSLLDLMAKCCKLTRLPGFSGGLTAILGSTNAAQFMALWVPLCALVDSFVAADNFFNQRDMQDDDGTGEDTAPA